MRGAYIQTVRWTERPRVRASVIGLLFWLSLHSVIALAGAELNAALIADGPPHPPDCD